LIKKVGDFSPTDYFLGLGGLLPAGPPGFPGFVLGLGVCPIGFLAMIFIC